VKQNPVYIIDGSSFLYRAYYSIRPLSTRAGIPVNAVYGFCRMIRKLIDTYHPTSLVLVWDSKGKTVRHEMYTAYKATRQAAPNDLMQQKELIQQFAELIGLRQLAMPGVEADDLMFSVAKQLEQEGQSSILVTSDKDLGQVLSDSVTILDPFKDAIITREALEAKLGFPIAKLPFYYALIGDSSDNIPGVAGIGPKGAQGLVTQFEGLNDLYANIEKIPSERTRMLLTQSKENAFLSEQLFLLRIYEVLGTYESFAFDEAKWEAAYPFFEKLEFRSLVKGGEYKAPAPEVTLHKTYRFVLVDTAEELALVCNAIKKHGICALDTETTGLRPLESEMVGISVCVEEGTAYYIPFGHKTQERQLPRELVISLLKPLLEDPSIKKYLHHAKFDALVLLHAGIDLRGIAFDTMIAASLLVTDGQRIGLKYLSEYYLGEPMLPFNDLVGRAKYKDFSYVPLAIATEYAAADAHQTMRLKSFFQKGLEEQGLASLFHDLEMGMMRVLNEMERAGIYLDTDVLDSIDLVVTKEVVMLKTQIIDLIGHEHQDINLNSPKQLEELLFNRLKLPVVKKTTQKTGYSTDQEVLEQLSKIHPVPALIMRYRELFKVKSTYLDSLGEYRNPETGRVHTTYNQTAVATGRLASSDPNLQNIPVDRFAVRSAFKPKEGSLFLSADYSQIELRVLAYVSQDSTLLTAFKENRDIHALTAAGLFSIAPDQVTGEMRQLGKRINFSILYGLTAHGLSKDLEISHSLAKSYIDKFMAQYPGVVAWMEKVIEITKEKGYVETVWGRRRYLPGIYERNRTLYDLARRVAINTVAQGTAAELMKWGMLELDKVLKNQLPGARMLLQIHDELLLEIPQELITAEPLIKSTLENIVSWNVPLVVTTRTGKDWQEVTK
jgi:DNA polymerase I